MDGQQTGFSYRLWISTTDDWSKNAEETLHGQSIPVFRLNLSDLETAPVDWSKIEAGVHGIKARTTKHALKPHQEIAVEKASAYFSHRDRGKLIMACGTGKTFTSLKIAEREAKNNRLVLVLVPSIALISQVLREWATHSEHPLNAICVCSDPKVSKQQKENETIGFTTLDLAYPATTKPLRVIHQYQALQSLRGEGKSLTVIFSTYQSIDVVEEAQSAGLPSFDIIICDEAHRTTGVELSDKEKTSFIKVHDNTAIKAHKRLYMTATPRIYTENSKTKAQRGNASVYSMDDPDVYGEEIHRIGFGEAVEKGLLSDYKVLIFTVRDSDVPVSFQNAIANADGGSELPADTAAQIVGCINALSKQVWGLEGKDLAAIDPGPMKRAVAFCQNISISRSVSQLFTDATTQYLDALPEEKRKHLLGVSSRHIDGTMNALERERLLNWLKSDSEDPDKCKVLSNVRCLSEGVDVPALDAILFLSARNSQVDVVQSVGRVMRRAEGKKYGYIIIPVLVPSDVEPDIALDSNRRFSVVWSVLNALRAHDDRFNATINRIELNKNRPDNIVIGGVTPLGEGDESISQLSSGEQLQLPSSYFQELQNVIYARLVQKVGERHYWEEWAKSVADIAQRQIERIERIVSSGKGQQEFEVFLAEMQVSIDKSITKERAIEMLAQHTITAPVFDALFESYAFAQNNAISVAMELMLEELNQSEEAKADLRELDQFYASVRRRAEGIDNAEARQKIILELYNTFFAAAFPKMVEQLGIVYTPVEVVDFIIRSVDDVLRTEFGRILSDENVNILDPFTGTGTFITRLIQNGLVSKADLPRKYRSEIFANELVLLAYYIAAVNIENAYHDEMGLAEYSPFEGIALTDTFQAWEESGTQLMMFDQNSDRVNRQNMAPITVIFGNPPYSVGQKSANDNAQNRAYPRLDESIAETYAALSEATSKKALYDSYLRAFRYATDRLRDGDGIICFVTNGAWLDSKSSDGFRKTLAREFSKIYVFNLRGNALSSGERRRKEGGNVFGSGSRTTVTITLLVKRNGFGGRAEILYCDIGNCLNRGEKLNIIRESSSFISSHLSLYPIHPNEYGDWLSSRKESFELFVPLSGDKKFDDSSESFFTINYLGIITSRDPWCYSFSRDIVISNMFRMTAFYNSQIEMHELSYDPTKISWSSSLTNYWRRKKKALFEGSKVRLSIYRPFSKQYVYHDEKMVHRMGQWLFLSPTSGFSNLIIATSGKGDKRSFSCIITNTFTDFHCIETTQCFPLYYYEEQEGQQFPLGRSDEPTQYIRRDGISDYILNFAREQYGVAVSKEDIFFYVYGFLHCPTYRETYADDLKKSLPRIPLVSANEDFWAFSKAGRALAELHIDYERVPPLDEVQVVGDRTQLHVTKMRFIPKGRRDVIHFNDHIRIENIPAEAYDYIVNGRSAIEWVMESYRIKTDKASGIIDDPNLYGEELGQPDYILKLLLSVIAVSVKTQEIIKSLPEFTIDEEGNE